MKFLLVCFLAMFLGIVLFDLSSERVWNNSFLSVFGLAIAWAGLIACAWKIYKMVSKSDSKNSEVH